MAREYMRGMMLDEEDNPLYGGQKPQQGERLFNDDGSIAGLPTMGATPNFSGGAQSFTGGAGLGGKPTFDPGKLTPEAWANITQGPSPGEGGYYPSGSGMSGTGAGGTGTNDPLNPTMTIAGAMGYGTEGNGGQGTEPPIPDTGLGGSGGGEPGGGGPGTEGGQYDWVTAIWDRIREYMDNPSRYDAALVQQGAKVIEDSINRMREQGQRTLGEHYAARGLTGSSLEGESMQQFESDLQRQANERLFNLQREQANTWAQDLSNTFGLGLGAAGLGENIRARIGDENYRRWMGENEIRLRERGLDQQEIAMFASIYYQFPELRDWLESEFGVTGTGLGGEGESGLPDLNVPEPEEGESKEDYYKRLEQFKKEHPDYWDWWIEQGNMPPNPWEWNK